MHIPNAVLDPRVSAATAVVGAAGLAYGLRTLERRLGERTTVLMGTTAAFVFAAQMVNFPLGPLGVSGHLLGGVLSAVMLGPWAGAVVIAAVLIVQCLLFGDGGLTALGANFVNMGLIGSVVGYAVYAPIRLAVGGPRGVILGAMAAAWFSVILAAGAFSVELAASGRWSDFGRVLSWMALVHAGIGVGEAIITGLVLRFLLLTRPDLIYEPDPGLSPVGRAGPGRWLQVGAAGLAVALAVGVFLAPLASAEPDGLEYVGGKVGFLQEGADAPSLPPAMPDYDARPLTGLSSVRVATAVAGALGTLAVFGVGLALAGAFGRPARGPALAVAEAEAQAEPVAEEVPSGAA
jgi:cobalt/nickel transport system permease protein